MSLIRNLVLGEGQTLTILPLVDSDTPGASIVPGESYVSVRLRSAHLKNSRKGWHKLYMCTYARGNLYHENDTGKAEFETVITPSFFKNIDSKHLDRVQTFDRLLFGPFPYIGGLELDIGMFSVKGADLVEPYLNLLEEISSQASLPFAKTAAPFVKAVKKGADELLGRSSDANLEIGLSRGYGDESLREGTIAVLRATDQIITKNDLKIDPLDYSLKWTDGRPFKDCPYFVYSIIASQSRNDWKRIPDLSSAWRVLNQEIKAGEKVRQAFKRFRLACLMSADLLETDKERLIAKARVFIDHVVETEGLEYFGENTGHRLPPFGALELFPDEEPVGFNISDSDDLFHEALEFILRWEGGYSNHPNNPGEEINRGITQSTYDEWRIQQDTPIRSVELISDIEVEEIYKQKYWYWANCSELTLHPDLPLVHFDTAVNMGSTRATKILQEAAGANPDGKFGPRTIVAVAAMSRSLLLENYCNIRERVFRSIAAQRPKLDIFLRGWLNRLNSLRVEAGLTSLESVVTSERFMSGAMGRLEDLNLEDLLEGSSIE